MPIAHTKVPARQILYASEAQYLVVPQLMRLSPDASSRKIERSDANYLLGDASRCYTKLLSRRELWKYRHSSD